MVSKRARKIKPSSTLAITAQAKALKAQGIDVVSFGAGEPDFDTPGHIKTAAKDAIDAGFTKYTPSSGIPELKQAICAKFRSDNTLDFSNEHILVSNGAKQCLYNIIQVLVDEGDEVLIPVPYWVSYEEMVKIAGGTCVFLEESGAATLAKRIETAASARTKLLILNSPNNPTGAVLSKDELQAIADVCVKKNITVISDEIYEKLIYDAAHASIASCGDKIKKLTVVVNGVSKAYAMTGWRIGYCAADKEIIRAASALQDHTTSNPNSIAQKAALAALAGPQDSVARMREEYKIRRDFIVSRLSNMNGISIKKPEGAFYAFPNISALYRPGLENSNQFCAQLLERAHVAAVPGSAFGDDRGIRFSFATGMKQIEEGMRRLEDFIGRVL